MKHNWSQQVTRALFLTMGMMMAAVLGGWVAVLAMGLAYVVGVTINPLVGISLLLGSSVLTVIGGVRWYFRKSERVQNRFLRIVFWTYLGMIGFFVGGWIAGLLTLIPLGFSGVVTAVAYCVFAVAGACFAVWKYRKRCERWFADEAAAEE